MQASYYLILENKKVRCVLCPHECILKPGQTGACRIRKNVNGELIAETFNLFSAVGFDPIEKKPLYHYHPGKEILSVGSFGCNMHCKWCQNCEISQTGFSEAKPSKRMNAFDLLNIARENENNIGIAFTYNEPSIAFESNIEIARLFSEYGLKNVMVTNGYMNHNILQEYLKYLNAFNVDIKAFNQQVHKKYTGAELDEILSNAKTIYRRGVHIELTFLVVPGVNDNEIEFVQFVEWIKSELSSDVPLHISKYFPRNNYTEPSTSTKLLERFASIAKNELEYVYVGNVNMEKYQNTNCPSCKAILISRTGYLTQFKNLKLDGTCEICGEKNNIIL